MSEHEHTIGSHSDDRGGASDARCICQDKTEKRYMIVITGPRGGQTVYNHAPIRGKAVFTSDDVHVSIEEQSLPDLTQQEDI